MGGSIQGGVGKNRGRVIQKKWFRIEHNADGSLGAVTEVDAKGRNGSIVRYYESVDAADACRQAKEWYENYRETHRRGVAARHTRLMAEGKCVDCGRLIGPYGTARRCRECSDRVNAAAKAWRERGRVPLPKKQPNVVKLRERVARWRKDGHERSAEKAGGSHELNKAYFFRKVLKESYAFTNLFQFQEWLRAQIRERGLEPPVKPSKKIDWLEDKIAKAAK